MRSEGDESGIAYWKRKGRVIFKEEMFEGNLISGHGSEDASFIIRHSKLAPSIP